MHGADARAADPADLMRDRALIGVHAQPRPQRRDPKRLVGPQPGGPDARVDQPLPPRRGGGPWHHQLDVLRADAAHETAVGQRGRGPLGVRGRQVEDVDGRAEERQHRQVGRIHLDLRPEHHLAQEVGERLPAPRLGVQRGDAAEFGLQPVVLDPALSVQAQVLDDGPLRQRADVLARDGVQPALAVVAGELDGRAVAAVHDDGLGGGGTLLPERVAVVPDGAGVGSGFGCGNCAHTSSLASAPTSLLP